ncbi:restriction endonuclease [Deinococcus radiophilus]|uniref:restriction endonuclease n=1 Tax=Deinococcus radiophilus TaxID=32062 RepID=UPI00362268EF
MTTTNKARTPWLPTYDWAVALYNILPNISIAAISSMERAINNQVGSAAHPVDWSKPDEWIAQRLEGEDKALALMIWESTDRLVNPRYITGSLILGKQNGLLDTSETKFQLTTAGQDFVRRKRQAIAAVDNQEGITQILTALLAVDAAKRKELYPLWLEELGGDNRAESTLMGLLYERLNNLIQRGLVERKQGHRYCLTSKGRVKAERALSPELSQRRRLDDAMKAYRAEQRQKLRDILSTMNPYKFEHLIASLLEEMDYTDVQVTKQSGDKGIDVVATARFGITTVREVVQVKRVQGTTGAPVINQLRGSLHTYNAIKGMVITLGTFSAEAKRESLPHNAAPITLIDGETLIDLLIEHEVGVIPRKVSVFDVDESFFLGQAPYL